MDAARGGQLAAMDAAELVAELRALNNAGGSSYDEQAQCCLHLCDASTLLTGAAAEDAIRAVVSALSHGVHHATLQLNGCLALGQLVHAAPASRAAAGAAGGITAVLAALRTHPGDVRVQSGACLALARLVAQNETNRATASAAGGVAAVVAAMTRHPTDRDVVFRCCDALAQLTLAHPHNAAAAVNAGAVTAVLAAMRAFLVSVQVQRTGCCALMFIAAAAGTLGGAHVDCAAADAVLDAMRTHVGDRVLMVSGCGVLNRHFQEDRNADAAWVRRGSTALEVITTALRTYQHDEDVLTVSCALIARLMVNTKENQRAAGVSGVIEAIVAALRAFSAAAELQRFGCCALGNACQGVRKNQLAAATAGGLEVIVAAMRTHASNTDVALAGCIALGDLATDMPPIQARSGELGAIEVLVAALRARTVPLSEGSAESYFRRWCEVMTLLLGGPHISQHKAVAAGAIELLLAHMRTPDVLPAVFDWACITLPVFFSSGHEARAITAGALEALETRRVADADVEEHRLELIRCLQPAARRHDAAPCAVAGCQRCAAARKSGVMCALPGCGARSRDGAASKKLLRCGTCRAACYCGAAHQREDWGRHKGACGAPPARNDAQTGGASGS
jgi:hypothetical protein